MKRRALLFSLLTLPIAMPLAKEAAAEGLSDVEHGTMRTVEENVSAASCLRFRSLDGKFDVDLTTKRITIST